jgi:hypothetical protein
MSECSLRPERSASANSATSADYGLNSTKLWGNVNLYCSCTAIHFYYLCQDSFLTGKNIKTLSQSGVERVKLQHEETDFNYNPVIVDYFAGEL